jgi:undecaprenyl diphosphate synthase
MIDKNNIPQHIAIIMDGNGRWAKQRNLPRTAGHREGINKIRKIIKAASGLGVKVLTLFAFSTENWDRPKKEVGMLMNIMERFLNKEIKDLHKKNIRFMTIGRKEPVPESLLDTISKAEELTKNNSGLIVNLAFNYGSRAEIIDAAKNLAEDVREKRIRIEEINEDTFSSFLYTNGLPDPDLLIRTSGEKRISNFLLWQLSYAELYFTKKYWPDFSASDLEEAVIDYQKRDRRFGEIKEGAR